MLAAALVAQLPARPGVVQRVKVESSISSETVKPGDSVVLSVQVSPNRDVRVFAPGAKDYTPVFLALSASHAYSIGKPKFPLPKRQSVPGTSKKVLLYDNSFTLEQTITIDKKAVKGDTLKITGFVNYQACDERTVYARSGAPVSWTVTIQ